MLATKQSISSLSFKLVLEEAYSRRPNIQHEQRRPQMRKNGGKNAENS